MSIPPPCSGRKITRRPPSAPPPTIFGSLLLRAPLCRDWPGAHTGLVSKGCWQRGVSPMALPRLLAWAGEGLTQPRGARSNGRPRQRRNKGRELSQHSLSLSNNNKACRMSQRPSTSDFKCEVSGSCFQVGEGGFVWAKKLRRGDEENFTRQLSHVTKIPSFTFSAASPSWPPRAKRSPA